VGKAISWTISNKYYTADVHFEVHDVRAWSSVLADGVPAVIFLWVHGEPYKDHAQYLSRELESHDAEVSLAVRVQDSSATPADDEDMDEFFSSLGFEFIDARPSELGDGHDNGEPLTDGVSGFPRIIDALSTIMWPSMVQSQHTHNRKSRARELLDWAREEEEHDGLRALVDPDSSTSDHDGSLIHSASGTTRISADRKSRMQREMDELERWLEEEEVLRVSENPWINVEATEDDGGRSELVDPLGMTMSPMAMETNNAPWTGMKLISDTPQRSGFDDDFTVFVSAPATSTAAGPFGTSKSVPNASFDSDMLHPMHTGASYASLGSVSDFGDHREENEDDLGLPTEAEIQATSSRIFGPTLSPPPLTHTPTARPAQPLSPSQPTATPFSTSTSFSHSDGHEDEDDGADYELGNFDLSRVLNALQNMKEEISGMEDEDERRRAAARAALGLVYGLERQGDGDEGGSM